MRPGPKAGPAPRPGAGWPASARRHGPELHGRQRSAPGPSAPPCGRYRRCRAPAPPFAVPRGENPGPVSSTTKTTRPCSARQDSVTVPPGGVNRTAFSNRFSTARARASACAGKTVSPGRVFLSTNCIFFGPHNISASSLRWRRKSAAFMGRSVPVSRSARLTVRSACRYCPARPAPRWMASTHWRWGAVSASSARRSAFPVMTASGVLRSWASAAVCSARCCSSVQRARRLSCSDWSSRAMAVSTASNSRTRAPVNCGPSSSCRAMASLAAVSRSTSRARKQANRRVTAALRQTSSTTSTKSQQVWKSGSPRSAGSA